MMKGRLRLVLALLTLGGTGCALILGIDDRPVVDAADAQAEASSDTCMHLQPPPPTGRDDDAAADNSYVVAAHGIDLGPPGYVLGYDLDDTCTCEPGSIRHDAGPSCTSAVSRSCDEEGGTGIDNAFGNIAYVKLLSNAALGVGSPTEGILCGRSTFLVVVGKYNGLRNDAEITLGFVLSPGLQTPHEDAEAPSNCNNGPESPLPVVYTPRWDGTDRWSSDTTFVIPKSLTPSQILTGYVSDGVLVARAAEGQSLLLPLGPIVGEAHGAIVRANLALVDGGLKITDGEVAARLTTSSVIAAISRVPLGGKGGYICPDNANASLYQQAVMSVCNGRDVLSDPAKDFAGVACDSISSAVQFFGDPAQMQRPIPPFDAGPGDCPDARASCD